MFGRKANNMNELYFVIRVWNFPHNKTNPTQYNVQEAPKYLNKTVPIITEITPIPLRETDPVDTAFISKFFGTESV